MTFVVSCVNSSLVWSWYQLDMMTFRMAIFGSRLCQPNTWPGDIDELCFITVNSLKNSIIYCHYIQCRLGVVLWIHGLTVNIVRPKRTTRQLERAYSAACRRSHQSVNCVILVVTLLLLLPRLHGTRRGAIIIISCGTGSVMIFGVCSSRLTDLILVSSGIQFTRFWIAANYDRVS
jgi:hypothetical protein